MRLFCCQVLQAAFMAEQLPSAPANTGAMHGTGAMLSRVRGQPQQLSLPRPLVSMLGTSEGQQQPRAPRAQQGTGMSRQQASTPGRTGVLLGVSSSKQKANMLGRTGPMQRASVARQQPTRPVPTQPMLATGSGQLQRKRPAHAGAIQAAFRAHQQHSKLANTGAMLGTSTGRQQALASGSRRTLQKKEGHPKKVQRPGNGQGSGQQARQGPAVGSASAPAAAAAQACLPL